MPLYTASTQAVRAVKALGLDVEEALREGEIDAAIYLLDQAGAGFGYRYQWEAFGPFSEDMAAELIDLVSEDVDVSDELDDATQAAVERVAKIIDVPAMPSAAMSQFTWLRLLASVDFLRYHTGLVVKNGDRPPYVERNFEEAAVEIAKQRLDGLRPE